jgi:hypothetical protein
MKQKDSHATAMVVELPGKVKVPVQAWQYTWKISRGPTNCPQNRAVGDLEGCSTTIFAYTKVKSLNAKSLQESQTHDIIVMARFTEVCLDPMNFHIIYC